MLRWFGVECSLITDQLHVRNRLRQFARFVLVACFDAQLKNI